MEQRKVRFLSNAYFEEILQRSGASWPIGGTVTFFLASFTFYLFRWAAHESVARESAAFVAETFIGPIDGSIVYLLPELFSCITLFFVVRTIRALLWSHCKEQGGELPFWFLLRGRQKMKQSHVCGVCRR